MLADRPVRVGDLCRFDERHGQGWNPVGTVEEFGLRSTKIRQFDSAGREAAQKRVRQWASAQELPFPDLAEDHRKSISDQLDYPPAGSPGADRG